MRERRRKEAGTVVFDYRDLVDKRKNTGKTLILMKKGPITYTSDEGTRFFKDHPFQWVKKDEAGFLLSLPEEGNVYFVNSTIEDVEDYYAD